MDRHALDQSEVAQFVGILAGCTAIGHMFEGAKVANQSNVRNFIGLKNTVRIFYDFIFIKILSDNVRSVKYVLRLFVFSFFCSIFSILVHISVEQNFHFFKVVSEINKATDHKTLIILCFFVNFIIDYLSSWQTKLFLKAYLEEKFGSGFFIIGDIFLSMKIFTVIFSLFLYTFFKLSLLGFFTVQLEKPIGYLNLNVEKSTNAANGYKFSYNYTISISDRNNKPASEKFFFSNNIVWSNKKYIDPAILMDINGDYVTLSKFNTDEDDFQSTLNVKDKIEKHNYVKYSYVYSIYFSNNIWNLISLPSVYRAVSRVEGEPFEILNSPFFITTSSISNNYIGVYTASSEIFCKYKNTKTNNMEFYPKNSIKWTIKNELNDKDFKNFLKTKKCDNDIFIINSFRIPQNLIDIFAVDENYNSYIPVRSFFLSTIIFTLLLYFFIITDYLSKLTIFLFKNSNGKLSSFVRSRPWTFSSFLLGAIISFVTI